MSIETEVYWLRINSETFGTLTPTEKALACLLGNAQNEIATLWKLLAWTGSSPKARHFDDDARDGMRNCVMRVLILKVRELYKTLRVEVPKRRDQIRPDAFSALGKFAEFDKSLGKDGCLAKIRDEMAAHYRLDVWEDNCSQIDPEFFQGYRLSDHLAANAYYEFADFIGMCMMFGIRDRKAPSAALAGFDKVRDELFSMLPTFVGVIDETLTVLLNIDDSCDSKAHPVKCAFSFEEIKLPWIAPFSE